MEDNFKKVSSVPKCLKNNRNPRRPNQDNKFLCPNHPALWKTPGINSRKTSSRTQIAQHYKNPQGSNQRKLVPVPKQPQNTTSLISLSRRITPPMIIMIDHQLSHVADLLKWRFPALLACLRVARYTVIRKKDKRRAPETSLAKMSLWGSWYCYHV